MSIPSLTIDELKSTLQKSFTKTMITEGRDDYSLFRSLNDEIGFDDIFPAGNKSSVLAIAEHHNSYTCPKVAYLVDQDLWTLSGVPEYIGSVANLTLTSGYSIENDILGDFNPERLIYNYDREDFSIELKLIIKWFSAGVVARLAGQPFDFERKISKICGFRETCLTQEAQSDVDNFKPEQNLIEKIESDYMRLLRGKTYLPS